MYFFGSSLSYRGQTYEIKNKVIQSREIYLRIVIREEHTVYRAFISSKKDSKFQFIRSDIVFSSFPVNLQGSIIYPFKATTLVDLFKSGLNIHEFLPSYVSTHQFPDFEFCDDETVILDDEPPLDYTLDEDVSVKPRYTERDHILTCYVCHMSCRSDIMFTDSAGIKQYLHKKCYRCECGSVRDIIEKHPMPTSENPYPRSEFRCNRPYRCDLMRHCIVCRGSDGTTVGGKYRIGHDGDHFYYHPQCVICECGYYVAVLERGGKYFCSCIAKPTVKMKERGKILTSRNNVRQKISQI